MTVQKHSGRFESGEIMSSLIDLLCEIYVSRFNWMEAIGTNLARQNNSIEGKSHASLSWATARRCLAKNPHVASTSDDL